MAAPPVVRPAAAEAGRLDRRRLLQLLAAGVALPAALTAAEKEAAVTTGDLQGLEDVIGLPFSDAERQLMLSGLGELREKYRQLRDVPLANDVPPALTFTPLGAGERPAPWGAAARWSVPDTLPDPTDEEALAFATVGELGALLRQRRIRSAELTELALARLERWDPLLRCVISLTRERAVAQAAERDRELAAGRDRGPLHGIPWGAKDLFAVRGYPTTWGAAPYRE